MGAGWGSPPLADVEGNVFGIEVLNHGPRRLVHQLLSQAQASMRTLHCLKGEGAVRGRGGAQLR